MKREKVKGLALLASSLIILSSLPVNASTSRVGEDLVPYSELAPDFQDDTFPEPASIRPNVRFWLDVYTKYDERDAIIHDQTHLDVVYEVVDLNETHPGKSRRQVRRGLSAVKREYAEMLRRLADNGGQCNSDEECRVGALFNNTADASVYREAANNIRVQYGLKSRFKLGLITSGQYMPEMKKIFQQYGVPLDLLALPHVESSFNVKAYSHVGAAGIWQFMRSTGKRYMKINQHIDERRDPLIATEGAARFLRDNYEELQSWPLVVTSYNHGKNGMRRAKMIYGDDIGSIIRNYDGPAFGFASRNFYCEFLAARKVVMHPEKYFGNIDFHSPLEFETVKLEKYVHIRELAKQFDLKEIGHLNPALHKNILSGRTPIPKGYTLRVPSGSAGRLTQVASYTPTEEEVAQAARGQASPRPRPENRKDYGALTPGGEYVVGYGDSLYSIAMKYNTTVAALKELNDLSRSRIHPGQKLLLPDGAAIAAAPSVSPRIIPAVARVDAPAEIKTAPAAAPKAPGAGFLSRVILRVSALIGWQKTAPAAPAPAAAPKIVTAAATSYPMPLPAMDRFRFIKAADGYAVLSVMPEETLGHYADWAGVSPREIMRFNKWRRARLQLWQTVKIPLRNVTATQFEQKRYAFHNGMFKDFFDAYSVREVNDRTLRRGQTAWTFCTDRANLPLWLLAMYNDGKTLDRLHAGETLRVPVIEKKVS